MPSPRHTLTYALASLYEFDGITTGCTDKRESVYHRGLTTLAFSWDYSFEFDLDSETVSICVGGIGVGAVFLLPT